MCRPTPGIGPARLTDAKQAPDRAALPQSTLEGSLGPSYGNGALKIIAAILERPVIEKILTHLGLDPQPPSKAPAREPGRPGAG